MSTGLIKLLLLLPVAIGSGSTRSTSNATGVLQTNTTFKAPATAADILQVVDALGGVDALDAVNGFTYNGGEIYRSATLSQTYDLNSLDQSVATTGSSNASFQWNQTGLLSRIDRSYAYDEYWVWEIPTLQPLVNMSLVVHDDEEQYACFVQGSNNFLSDFRSTQGYIDGLVTNYLIHQAHQFALPWLLQRWLANSTELQGYQVQERYSSAIYNALEDPALNLTLLVDLDTNLPHAVRSSEDHVIYGPSTNDLVFTDFRKVAIQSGMNISLPHRLQTLYNSRFILEDILLQSISINPPFPNDFFQGQAPSPPDPSNTVQRLAPAPPSTSSEYPLSEVHEWYEAGIWTGPFTELYNTSSVNVTYPDPNFKNIMKVYVGYEDYVQLLIEHETGFIITDAPPHRSTIILEWLNETRSDKKITHVVPTHHHSDHADGVDDYVRAGASLVVPYVARDYYQQAGNKSSYYNVITYDAEHAFVFKDSLIEFYSFWQHGNPHAEDQGFPVVTKANATSSDLFVLYEADVVNPGSKAVYYKSLYAWDLLIRARNLGLPRSTVIVSAHVHGKNTTGESTSIPLEKVGEDVGFTYPNLTMRDWRECLAEGCQM